MRQVGIIGATGLSRLGTNKRRQLPKARTKQVDPLYSLYYQTTRQNQMSSQQFKAACDLLLAKNNSFAEIATVVSKGKSTVTQRQISNLAVFLRVGTGSKWREKVANKLSFATQMPDLVGEYMRLRRSHFSVKKAAAKIGVSTEVGRKWERLSSGLTEPQRRALELNARRRGRMLPKLDEMRHLLAKNC